jgi:catechol 2,3-dioxygenase-like lactoylglutathione lyase family enzyme
MRRFHVHVAVGDFEANVRFYSAMFGTEPSVKKDDYAKWMLEDPRINFAISKRGHRAGVNHLGIQVDSDIELDAMRIRLEDAEIASTTPGETACCYARSGKYWTTDPQGITWETFHTLGDIPIFGEDSRESAVREAAVPAAVSAQTGPIEIALAQQPRACCPAVANADAHPDV